MNGMRGRSVVWAIAALACLGSVFADEGAKSPITTKRVLVTPFLFPKQKPNSEIDRPDPETVRQAYDTRFEKFWAENSYDIFTVDTKTFGYVHMPWPKNAQATGGKDFNGDNQLGTGTGETFIEYDRNGNPALPYNGESKILVADGVWTPGERFLDLNGNGRWDDIEDFWDTRENGPGKDTNKTIGGFAKQYDKYGEEFIDWNGNGEYDEEVTITIYDAEADQGTTSSKRDGRYPIADFIANDGIIGDPQGTVGVDCYFAERTIIVNELDFNVGDRWSNNSLEYDPTLQANHDGDREWVHYTQGDSGNSPSGGEKPAGPCNGTFDAAKDADGKPILESVGSGTYIYRKLDSKVSGFGDDKASATITEVTATRYRSTEIFDDRDENGEWSNREPYEDYLIRWDYTADPDGDGIFGAWVRVDEKYIERNYPPEMNDGQIVDVDKNGIADNIDKLIDRCGNGKYDGPEAFTNIDNTKMEPRSTPDVLVGTAEIFWDPHNEAGGSVANWYMQEYGTSGSTGIAKVNVDTWSPPAEGSARCGLYSASPEDPDNIKSFGEDDKHEDDVVADGEEEGILLLPDAHGKYYDSAREFRDLPSSMYHTGGDLRFGEETDPESDSINGVDKGSQSAYKAFPDGVIPLSGPLAYNIYGDLGQDAGNQAAIEFMTWRTDGKFVIDNAAKDVNLDGLIDQGECPDKGFNNYIEDLDPVTPNNGAMTNYPFNRTRVVEDIIEVLDGAEDFESFSKTGSAWIDYVAALYPDGYGGTDFQGLSGLVVATRLRDSPGGGAVGGQVYNMAASADPDPDVESQDMFAMGVIAHEACHDWLDFPDLYDYDVFNGIIRNNPIGSNDIMAGGPMTHFVAPLKDRWSEIRELKEILTPNMEQTLLLKPVEKNKNQYFVYGRYSGGEALYFWYQSGDTVFNTPGGKGIRILHSDDSNPQAAPPQQRMGGHFGYEMVQADGKNHLEAGYGSDDGDPWPGSSGNTWFDETTYPPSIWFDQVPTGIEIHDIYIPNDVEEPAEVTFFWRQRELPDLKFIDPPGGYSINGFYTVNYSAYDQFGGSTIYLYRDDENKGYDKTALIDTISKVQGERLDHISDDIRELADGDYYYFALLVPGPDPEDDRDEEESKVDTPRGAHWNKGDGNVEVNEASITIDPNTADFSVNSSVQTWTLYCVDATLRGAEKWTVKGSVSGEEEGYAVTGAPFTTKNDYSGGFTFTIKAGSAKYPWKLGDALFFNTTGLTQYSEPITVKDGEVPVSEVNRDVITDTDKDGMDDDWEMSYFHDLHTSDGKKDSDGDGLTDYYEFYFGRNPLVDETKGSGDDDDDDSGSGDDDDDDDDDGGSGSGGGGVPGEDVGSLYASGDRSEYSVGDTLSLYMNVPARADDEERAIVDVYIALVTPDGGLLTLGPDMMWKGPGVIDPMVTYWQEMPMTNQKLAEFYLGSGVPSGTYQFYFVLVRAGRSVYDYNNWVQWSARSFKIN